MARRVLRPVGSKIKDAVEKREYFATFHGAAWLDDKVLPPKAHRLVDRRLRGFWGKVTRRILRRSAGYWRTGGRAFSGSERLLRAETHLWHRSGRAASTDLARDCV